MASFRQLCTLTMVFGTVAAMPSPLNKRTALPSYALSYAPISYLMSTESWFPSDITTHLANTAPYVNSASTGAVGSVTVNTLGSLSNSAYLTAPNMAINPSNQPAWLTSAYGKPNAGLSGAPGTIIAVQKNATTVDVFYFYFYSYNYGGT
jgi:hypothetical protein